MLIQFSITNFKSFKNEATISLLATNYDKDTRINDNIVTNKQFNLQILKSAVIYGANASGKSKLLEALMFMRGFVISSSRDSQAGDPIHVDPFRLSSETEKAPSEFEAIFIQNNTIYRYGFEVDKQKVVAEWLFKKPKTKEIELFYRDHQTFETHARSFTKGQTIIKEGLVRNNALLVSVAAQFNEGESIAVIDWFKKLKSISGLKEAAYQGYTMGKTKQPELKKKILELLKAADLGIRNIKLEKLDVKKLPKEMPKEMKEKITQDVLVDNIEYVSDVLMAHKKYDSEGNYFGDVDFSLENDESSGTRKFFALTGPVLNVIENGHTLVVDELDAKLHPNLVCKIVSLFNSKELNPKNAQLIFNTHDTKLLGSGLFRRDQVWFTQKNKLGEAKLYSLSDFKSTEVRKTDDFEGKYISGRYGAIPYLEFFDDIIKSLPQHG